MANANDSGADCKPPQSPDPPATPHTNHTPWQSQISPPPPAPASPESPSASRCSPPPTRPTSLCPGSKVPSTNRFCTQTKIYHPTAVVAAALFTLSLEGQTRSFAFVVSIGRQPLRRFEPNNFAHIRQVSYWYRAAFWSMLTPHKLPS